MPQPNHCRTARRRTTVLGALVAAALLAGCGSDHTSATGDDGGGGGGTAASGPNGEAVEVLAVDNSFNPKEATIEAGTEVVWENRGRNEHNIIPEDADAEWRVETEDFPQGATASHVFLEPGTYRYYCSIHGTIDRGMPGVIVVE